MLADDYFALAFVAWIVFLLGVFLWFGPSWEPAQEPAMIQLNDGRAIPCWVYRGNRQRAVCDLGGMK